MTPDEKRKYQTYSRYAKDLPLTEGKNRRKRAIIVILLLFLLLVGAAAYLFFAPEGSVEAFGHRLEFGGGRILVVSTGTGQTDGNGTDPNASQQAGGGNGTDPNASQQAGGGNGTDSNTPKQAGGGNGDGSDHGSGISGTTEIITEQQPYEAETEDPLEGFAAYSVESTHPDNLISFTEVEYNGTVLESTSEFTPWYWMDFGRGASYGEVDGVITFRGNSFRDDPACGFAQLEENTLTPVWSKGTGGLSYNGESWSGSGWTGQPLIVKWPADVKQSMNLYEWAKNDDELVEVIYACMDGYVYFLDLKTGSLTRDSLYLGYTFKGAGALDPRGYPIMYLGAGYDSNNGKARAFILNLLDGSIMYTFGNDDPFSLRYGLSYFDSSALVDAASDTLIYPGENGILYLIHLNTNYDRAAGTLDIDPDDIVKWRYQGVRSSSASYWLGMEDSAAVFGGYLYMADNGGNLMCLNLNTLELAWVADVLDDSNSTPVLSEEDGHLYLYVSTSFHMGWRSSASAAIPIWKIDAQTGEIVWQTEYECFTQKGVSGGVQSTIAVGKNHLSDYLYVTVAMTNGTYSGVLACLNKKTGEIVWEDGGSYTWSSPVCVYNEEGLGRVIYCNSEGNMLLLNGLTGERLDAVSLSDGVIEASPAVYDSYVVVGTRACKIWGIELK